MRAVLFEQYKSFPVLTQIERPTPGPGEVLLKVAGAGACHSDVAIFHEFEGDRRGGLLAPPFVLGHESSGWVEEIGPGVSGVSTGEAYLVYGPLGCERCPSCARGENTYCTNKEAVGSLAMGLGRHGGMAEYMVVPVRNLVPLGDADPIDAAPLADAGLTPYHAIKRILPHLNGGGRSALVIGLGGLGQIGVQILKALTGAQILATDLKPEAMAQAQEFGAVTVPGGDDQVARIKELTGGRGVDAVIDMVGVDSTLALAGSVVAERGSVTVVGISNGTYAWQYYGIPYEVNFSSTYWGTLEELHEVVAMYRAGQITPLVRRFPMDEALEAYRMLRDGELNERAVVVPHPAGA